MRTVLRWRAFLVGLSALALAGCGGDDDAGGGGDAAVVVTTSILGDVVTNLVGDEVRVQVLMPPGTDPHDFAPSARQAAAVREADVLVVNGLGFEAGLTSLIDAAAADGVVVVTATDAVDALPFEHDGDAHADEETDADDGDGHDDGDPHFFTDPARMRQAVSLIADALAQHVDGLDSPAFRARVEAYLDALDALDAEVAQVLGVIPDERRLLVTNHEVFGYFADRYGFEVVGAVVPGGTTLAEPSAAELTALAQQIRSHRLPAIFAETSAPARLARALAAEGTDVEVVELYSEALGPAGSDGATYLDMVRTNARRIAAALG